MCALFLARVGRIGSEHAISMAFSLHKLSLAEVGVVLLLLLLLVYLVSCSLIRVYTYHVLCHTHTHIRAVGVRWSTLKSSTHTHSAHNARICETVFLYIIKHTRPP